MAVTTAYKPTGTEKTANDDELEMMRKNPEVLRPLFVHTETRPQTAGNTLAFLPTLMNDFFPTVQLCDKTMHVLTCPLHALVYEIECDYRASQAQDPIHPELSKGHSNIHESFHSVLTKFKSNLVKSTEVKQDVYLQFTSAVALAESRKGHFRLSVDLEKAAELVNVPSTCLEGILAKVSKLLCDASAIAPVLGQYKSATMVLSYSG